jgi:cell division septal protein FtsQ
MPVEINTADGRLWARRVVQHHERLPLVRTETRLERRWRRTRAFAHLLVIAGVLALIFSMWSALS